jgi:hypothetical protein
MLFSSAPNIIVSTLHRGQRPVKLSNRVRGTVPDGHMDRREAQAAVGRLCAHARAQAGSGAKLARAIERWYGSTDRSTVDAWANGSGNPAAWVVFALAHQFGLSLDEFLLSADDRRSLQEQLGELRQDVQALQIQVARIIEEDRGAAEEA